MDSMELRGRAVAQHCFSELEKIAYSAKTRALYATAKSVAQEGDAAAKTLGMSRFIPFTKEHRAYYGHVGVPGSGVRQRVREAANAAEAQASKERGALLGVLESGKGNSKKIIKSLKNGPQNVGRVATTARRAARSVGASVPVEDIAPTPASGANPNVRNAIAATGLVGAGAIGAYAGQQYLNGQKPQYGGGGY